MISTIKKNWFVVLSSLSILMLLLVEANGIGDFDIFISASKNLLAGENIYQTQYHHGFHYFYDVLFALIISPLQWIPIYWANFIWLVLNVFFTYRLWKIIMFYIPKEHLNKTKIRILTAASFIFIFALWHKNIRLTQMTIFILYLCLEGFYQIENRKVVLGSLFIALGISIKILPIVLIPYFIYRGYFKASVCIVVCTVIILFLPIIIIGYDYHIFLLQERWTLINPLDQEHILDVSETSFHSLTTLLSVLMVENAGNPYSLELKRNIANVDLDTLKTIINIARGFLILFTLYFIRSILFEKSKNNLQGFYELSYILLIIPLMFPHQQHYAFFFVFPAITYLIFYTLIKYFDPAIQVNKLEKICFISILIIIYLLLNSHFILGEYRDVYDHFKTLTYGIILLIPLLAVARPGHIISTQNKTSLTKPLRNGSV